MTDNKNKDSLSEPAISIEASDRAGTSIDVSIKPKKLKKQQRKKALNFISLANVIAISAVFAGGFVYVALLPHETKADDENRYLTEFPEFSAKSYASGEFTEGVADYFDDTVHDRAHIKEFISDYIMQLKGRKYGGDGEEARQDEEVARMRVCVEKAVPENLLHHQICAAPGHQRQIIAFCLEPCRV